MMSVVSIVRWRIRVVSCYGCKRVVCLISVVSAVRWRCRIKDVRWRIKVVSQ